MLVYPRGVAGDSAWGLRDQRRKLRGPPSDRRSARTGFYAKILDFHGIPIKAHMVVSDERSMRHTIAQPPAQKSAMVTANLAAAGAELHHRAIR
jgi:hypothetical protein